MQEELQFLVHIKYCTLEIFDLKLGLELIL